MASILSNYTSKCFLPISQLEGCTEDFGSNFSFYEGALSTGNVHSLYSKISYNEYVKLINIYAESTNVQNQYFYHYSNNKIDILIMEDKENDKIYIERWEVIQPSTVYSFKCHDTCYVIDEFQGRTCVKAKNLIDLSCRLASYGNWFTYDQKRVVFLGCRVLPRININEPLNFEFISTESRKMRNLASLTYNSAKYTSAENEVNNKELDYFIMFRNVSTPNRIYTEAQINSIYKHQKLTHLIEATDLGTFFEAQEEADDDNNDADASL
ncbi:hypothetical protein PvNV_078 [Penaeus vannamei nudivirus]|nr:hypothetical protein PvSNPV_078 [Penaeus vannamei nucleopolyhedrovirus]